MKKSLYAFAGLSLLTVNNAFAGIGFDGSNAVDANLQGSSETVDNVLETWIGYLTGFLYLIAIALIFWGAFNILTAAGDEEKVKKGKSILLQAVAGLVVIFLANSIITWVISGLFGSTGA